MIDGTQFHIGDEPQLFIDNWMIECTQGLTRRWHKPVRRDEAPVLRADRPWEKTLYFTYSNYCVLRDPADGLVKCWYEDLGPLAGVHPAYTSLLYAQSADGITFDKPELDICKIDGAKTNIVMGFARGGKASAGNPWAEMGVHSSSVVIDPYARNRDERYRMIFTRTGESHATECAHSADGLHWTPYETIPTFGCSGHRLSDVSCLFYDHNARQFVQNTRHAFQSTSGYPPQTPSVSGWFAPYYPHRDDLMNKRRVFQTHSGDFLHWSEPICVSCPDDTIDNLDEAHYGMGQFSVGRMHFATLGVFKYVADEMEVRLLFSRDGLNFSATDRGDAFLSPRGEGHWDARMVSMTSAPIEMGDQWWFYHGGSSCHHDWWMSENEAIDEPEARDPNRYAKFGMGVAVLRKEGVASLRASRQRQGYLITRAVRSPGDRLIINGRCNKGGSIRVAVLGRDDAVVGGCELDACDVFTGDLTDHEVSWRGSPIIGEAGHWRKLKFYIRDAELFSFRFASKEEANNA